MADREELEIADLVLLEQWNKQITSQNRSAVAALCNALSCIGHESLSQDVARLCDPFVLEGTDDWVLMCTFMSCHVHYEASELKCDPLLGLSGVSSRSHPSERVG